MATKSLRAALAANLVFSTLCGAALALAGGSVAQMMGSLPGWLMTVLGTGLLGFAASIAFVLLRLRIGWALIISVLDLAWMAATLPLVAIPGLLTNDGSRIVLLVAGIVGVLAVLQLRGIKAILSAGQAGNGTYRHCVRLRSTADPDALWAVIRDLGAISRYTTGLKSSRLEGNAGPATGAVRVCTNHRDQRWAEDVVSMDDANRSVVLRFRAEAEDFPFPLASMEGGWSVRPDTNGSSTVEVWWTVRPKMRRMGWLLLALMTIPLDRDIRKIVAAMQAGGPANGHATPSGLPALGYC